jgi:hypothetical protein
MGDAAERMKSGILAESIGLELAATNRRSEAAIWFRRAQDFYQEAPDKARVDFHLVAASRAAGKIELTKIALKEAGRKYGSAPEAEAFAAWVFILENPPSD